MAYKRNHYGVCASREALEVAVLSDENKGLDHQVVADKLGVSYSMIQRIRTPPPRMDRRYDTNPLTTKLNELWHVHVEEDNTL